MSIFHTAEVSCPACGTTSEFPRAASVNADRRPDLRVAILDRSFQTEPCPNCGAPLSLSPHLTYVDMARGNWILVEEPAHLPDWQTLAAEAADLFEDAFGAKAPPAARELAVGVSPRVVFGWPALREKLLCTELGLDDLTLELLKMAMMRGASGTPIGPALALRLVSGDAETLQLDVTNDDTQERIASTEVPRSLYDDIDGDTASWAALRSKLATDSFVDTTRFLVG